MSIKQYKAAY